MRTQKSIHWRLLICLAMIFVLIPSPPASAQVSRRAREGRPPLSYFVLTASLQSPLILGAQLTPVQFDLLRRVAEWEQAQLHRLLLESRPIVSDPRLSLEQKRLRIQGMGYNQRVAAILYGSDRALRQALDNAAYIRLARWIEARWPIEQRLHSGRPAPAPLQWRANDLLSLLFPGLAPPKAPLSAPRTYEIFATRYDAKGRYTAALPDQCVKLTNGGLRTCADQGYVVGQRYEIFMSYKNGKKGVGVVVAEAGPWNIDDNFWATLADPTPRRMFADLPLGMPEAQAAFFNGYNGGLDQYGRKVTAPFAIDLAFEVADDLGLPARTNDWINVSFMWTDDWGAGSSTGSAPPASISPVETVTYKPDGSQVHVVQSGQTLWAIALAYGVSIQRLRELNRLGESDVILLGQELVVRPAGATPTPGLPLLAPTLAETPSPAARRTEETIRTTFTPLVSPATPENGKATPVAGIDDPGPRPSETTALGFSPGSLMLFGILGLLVAGAALYLLGRWLSQRD